MRTFVVALVASLAVAGTASALLGCTQLVLAAAIGQVFMRRFFDGGQLTMAAAIALFACAVLGAYLALVRPLRARPS